MRALETPTFTIRHLHPEDADMFYNVVNNYGDRIKADFPLVVDAHSQGYEASVDRTKHLARSSNPGSGCDVLVATDPDNKIMFGAGTRTMLGRRAMAALNLRSATQREFDATMLIAGWTTTHHPPELATAGIRQLMQPPETNDLTSKDAEYLVATLIRPRNVGAWKLVEKFGMITPLVHKRSLFNRSDFLTEISPRRSRVAGINDGATEARWLWGCMIKRSSAPNLTL